jgi:hypothetical protein
MYETHPGLSDIIVIATIGEVYRPAAQTRQYFISSLNGPAGYNDLMSIGTGNRPESVG